MSVEEPPPLDSLLAPLANATCGDHVEQGSVSTGLVAMGTLLVIAASFISCFGVNLQKWAHNHNEDQAIEQRKPMYKNWRWWLGIIAMILGSIMDMAALPFVPLSRVAALGSSTIVANIIITPLFLKEKLTRHDLMGCIVTVTGTAVACYFGAGKESKMDSHCVITYFTEPLFVVYGVCVTLGLLVLGYFMIGFWCVDKKARELGIVGGEDQPHRLETVWVHDHLELVNTVPHHKLLVFVTKFGPQFYPSVFAVYAGTIGAQSVMFAKAVLIFLTNSVKGESTGHSVAYLLLFLIPTTFCLWNQIHFLNVALQIYCDAIFVLPVYQALWICSGIGSGLIFYKEYREITGLKIALFGVGILTALLGLGILANRKSRATERRTQLSDREARSRKQSEIELGTAAGAVEFRPVENGRLGSSTVLEMSPTNAPLDSNGLDSANGGAIAAVPITDVVPPLSTDNFDGALLEDVTLNERGANTSSEHDSPRSPHSRSH